MSTRSLNIDLPDQMWSYIDRLAAALPGRQEKTPVETLVATLPDHVQQGVSRPAAWERGWLEQCLGPEAVRAAYRAGHIDQDGDSAH